MMAFVVAVTPLTMVSGLVDWKYRYGMQKIPVIQKKVITAVIGYAFAVLYVIMHSAVEPEVTLVLLGFSLLFFVLTGEYGGRLIHGSSNAALMRKFQK